MRLSEQQIKAMVVMNIIDNCKMELDDSGREWYSLNETQFGELVGTLVKNINDIKPVLSDADVRWHPRYSSTMEDDDMGRWARVAYAGSLDNLFINGKVSSWEIAWISKLDVKGELKFTISYKFPSNGKHIFDSLEDAQKEVEQTFRWFMEMCGGN